MPRGLLGLVHDETRTLKQFVISYDMDQGRDRSLDYSRIANFFRSMFPESLCHLQQSVWIVHARHSSSSLLSTLLDLECFDRSLDKVSVFQVNINQMAVHPPKDDDVKLMRFTGTYMRK